MGRGVQVRLLRQQQQSEEEYPQHAHDMPIPAGGIDNHLANFHPPGGSQGNQRDEKSGDAKHQMKRMGARHQVEEVAVGIGCHEDAFAVQLAPGNKLPGNKKTSQDQRGHQPREALAWW